ncbi:hypothetical protein NIASO_01925 [Niabella soli DSM 19437]|uniref:Uncharacterized protein n=1 Tax=Niabella soli DSM 19437 TaxID=929713 RepID=W0F283_9BACT|nr:hypothetical protein NIASO_01925 [Niabella soli DSM 19437]
MYPDKLCREKISAEKAEQQSTSGGFDQPLQKGLAATFRNVGSWAWAVKRPEAFV